MTSQATMNKPQARCNLTTALHGMGGNGTRRHWGLLRVPGLTPLGPGTRSFLRRLSLRVADEGIRGPATRLVGPCNFVLVRGNGFAARPPYRVVAVSPAGQDSDSEVL